MAIQSDASGFLVGERRLKELAQGINQTQDNTKKILQILIEQFNEIVNSMRQSNESVADILQRSQRNARQSKNATGQSDNSSANRTQNESKGNNSDNLEIRYTRQAIAQVIEASNQLIDTNIQSIEADRQRTRAIEKQIREAQANNQEGLSIRRSEQQSVSSVSERANQSRERDANGRFVSDASNSAEGKSLLAKAKGFFKGTGGVGGDVSGVDPTLDAMGELKTVLNPVGRVFGKMSAKAISLFAGRVKKRRIDEILPEEQVRANADQSRGDRQRNKLLQKLIDAIRSNSGSSGAGGLLGGLLGGRKGGLGSLVKGGKALLKRLPLIGALFGGGALAMNWGGLGSEGKGKGIGEILGTAVGGVLGSFFSPLGTILGATLGNKLGGIFGEKIGSWVDHLKKIDFGALFTKAMNLIKDAAENIKDAALNPLGTLFNAGRSMLNYAKEKVSGGSSGGGYVGMGSKGQTLNGGGSVGAASGRYAPLLDMIAEGESKNGAFGTSGYDAVYSGAKVKPSKPVSQMTIGEVKAYQDQLLKAGSASTAVGRYQFIRNKGAFGKMASEAGLKDTDIFDEATQDKLAIHYFGGEKQLDKWIQSGNVNAITNKSAQQWASMKNTRGVGNYDGDGLNKARHGGVQEIRKATEQIRSNQIVSKEKETPTKASPVKATPLMPVAKKPVESSVVFPNGVNNPFNIKVPNVIPELSKTKPPVTAQATARQSDGLMGQSVSDRALAHVMAGGLGYNTLNA